MTTIDLASLESAGTTIFGVDANDVGGGSVSSAGDVNGDGFDDLIIGARFAQGSGNATIDAGESYVVFGGAALPATIELANLGSAGITIFGVDANDVSGGSVSSAGDVNGDGFDDLLIGALGADGSGNATSDAGESYVILGGALLPATVELANLGSAGITIFGVDANDVSGGSVSSARDVNGDGFDDLLIGALGADGSGNATGDVGESYVIFGGALLPATIELANLGSAGITIFGVDANDASGGSVSSAGDVNGDGFDDLFIGAWLADGAGNGTSAAGESYVVFGGESLPATIDLATLGSAGITIFGSDGIDVSGGSVSSAGDVNGDGFDDLIIGAWLADGSGNATSDSGESYVVFGGASLRTTIDLASLGSAGITIFGVDANDQSSGSVSSAGDVNGDGFDDLLIGALGADGSGNAKNGAGESYVIFGGASLPATFDLANLDSAGITVFGVDPNDVSGGSVSSAGDVNGDGFDDLIIGARFARGSGNIAIDAGESYVIFGGNNFTSSVTHLGTAAAETLTGNAAANVIVGAAGHDTLIGSGGADVIYGGSGDDVLAISDSTFQRLDGGNGSDTLRLDGSGLTLNLTTLADNKLSKIETIDIRGSGANTLTLTVRRVLNLTANSNPARTANTLTIRRDSDDAVSIGAGWTRGSNTAVNGVIYQVFNQGAATLKVEQTNQRPVFTSGATPSVPENTMAVLTVIASDADLPAQSVAFSLTGGADQGKFSITSAGVLTFTATPDFESSADSDHDNVYLVQVTADDNAGGTTVQNLSVTVTPANDNNPAITSGATPSVAENTTAVLTVIASDADLPAQSVTFSLTGGADQGKFSITSAGVLTFTATPDFEAPADADHDNVYLVQVTAADSSSPSLSVTQSLTIRVNDANDPPTAIGVANSTVKENISGAPIGDVSVVDQDAADTHALTVEDARFEIVDATLKLKTDQFLSLANGTSVSVEVTATDSGSPPRVFRQTLVIFVTANSSAWRHEPQPVDTNADGVVVPQDALRVINQLNNSTILELGGRLPPSRSANSSLPFYDVNGDGFCTPIDVLWIVNYLTANQGEGEAARLPVELTRLIPPRSEEGYHGAGSARRDFIVSGREQLPIAPSPPFAGKANGGKRLFARQAQAPIVRDDLESVLDDLVADVCDAWWRSKR